MRSGDAALHGHALVALRHATETIIGNERYAAGHGDGAGGLFLSKSRYARHEREGGTGDFILHEHSPLRKNVPSCFHSTRKSVACALSAGG
ncbi:hypothetical protein IL54_3731 [Sphingobium sp. ba1]|nr:hypothetical protein IL54_3731 [Sphingobium sp. ba1]